MKKKHRQKLVPSPVSGNRGYPAINQLRLFKYPLFRRNCKPAPSGRPGCIRHSIENSPSTYYPCRLMRNGVGTVRLHTAGGDRKSTG